MNDHLASLLAAGEPVTPPSEEVTPAELAAWAEHGGSSDWLAEEPDLYSTSDGEPV